MFLPAVRVLQTPVGVTTHAWFTPHRSVLGDTHTRNYMESINSSSKRGGVVITYLLIGAGFYLLLMCISFPHDATPEDHVTALLACMVGWPLGVLFMLWLTLSALKLQLRLQINSKRSK